MQFLNKFQILILRAVSEGQVKQHNNWPKQPSADEHCPLILLSIGREAGTPSVA